MSFTFYIFGNPNDYDEYPDDSSGLIKSFAQNRENDSQLLLSRQPNNSVYYTYLRKLDHNSDDYLGICLIFDNNMYCCDLSNLYAFFDKIYQTILHRGKLLKKNHAEQVVFRINAFEEEKTEIAEIEKDIVRKEFDNELKEDFKKIDDTFKYFDYKDILFEQISMTEGNRAILKKWKKYCPSICVSWDSSSNSQNGETGINIEKLNKNGTKKTDPFDKTDIVLSIIAAILFFAVIGIIIFKSLK